jgi:exodeoxyribonuclease VII large subunit
VIRKYILYFYFLPRKSDSYDFDLNEIKHIKLSELTKKVADVISHSFGDSTFWLVAEISSHNFYANQDRHYFDFIEKVDGIKDPIAKVRGISWSDGSQSIKAFEKATGQIFTNGVQVLVNVKIEFHDSYGFSLILIDIDSSYTLGNLEKLRRATFLKLVNDNPEAIQKVGEEYVTKNKNTKLPKVIQKMAIIASHKSEGYTDFIHTIENNQYNYKFSVDIYHSSVQGAASETELINNLILVFKSAIKYDSVVIIRGGGSKTDFLVFDSYALARAVARFPIPIIVGIGHHKDVSIVDLMANTSMKTPTKAAEFIISHNRTFEDEIIVFQKSVIIKSQQLLRKASQKINSSNVIMINKSRTIVSFHKDRMNNYNQKVINKTKTILYTRQTNLVSLLSNLLSKPTIITAHKQNDLANLVNNLNSFSKKYIKNLRGYLRHYDSVIKLVSPENTLKRGFAIVSQNDTILKNAEKIFPGSELKITMMDYDINTRVITKNLIPQNQENGTESVL